MRQEKGNPEKWEVNRPPLNHLQWPPSVSAILWPLLMIERLGSDYEDDRSLPLESWKPLTSLFIPLVHSLPHLLPTPFTPFRRKEMSEGGMTERTDWRRERWVNGGREGDRRHSPMPRLYRMPVIHSHRSLRCYARSLFSFIPRHAARGAREWGERWNGSNRRTLGILAHASCSVYLHHLRLVPLLGGWGKRHIIHIPRLSPSFTRPSFIHHPYRRWGRWKDWTKGRVNETCTALYLRSASTPLVSSSLTRYRFHSESEENGERAV